ncbi:MAG: hypothetical protein FD172_1311 [Methylocystaceae bacterium]|nr:MAG: hypothetical protein FD172_1311 [Methylocystaceae bacterium]
MGRFFFAAACGLSLFAAAAIAGDDTDDHGGHMKQMNMEHMKMSPKMSDTRQEVDLPAPMRAHMLANMRGHAEAVAEILAALGKGDGAHGVVRRGGVQAERQERRTRRYAGDDGASHARRNARAWFDDA